ncbi:MAG: hypothetical protein J6M14_00710 [Campylobacter sp.]|nr:hypothetical protein [Campylobacter sp.]
MQNIRINEDENFHLFLNDYIKKHDKISSLKPFYFYMIVMILPLFLSKDIKFSNFITQFINFMAEFFPNIKIVASLSKQSDFIAFYYAFSWLVIIGICIYLIIDIPKAYERSQEFFGTGNFQKHELSEILIDYYKKRRFWTFIALVLLFNVAFKNFTGSIYTTTLFNLELHKYFDNSVSLYIINFVFQGFALLVAVDTVRIVAFHLLNSRKVKK